MGPLVNLDSEKHRAINEDLPDGHELSEAANGLIRTGVASDETERRFVQGTRASGVRMKVSNVADVVETLEGSDHR